VGGEGEGRKNEGKRRDERVWARKKRDSNKDFDRGKSRGSLGAKVREKEILSKGAF